MTHTLKIQDKVEVIGLEKIAKTNASLIKAPYTQGGRIFLREWRDKNKKEITDKEIPGLIEKAAKRAAAESETLESTEKKTVKQGETVEWEMRNPLTVREKRSIERERKENWNTGDKLGRQQGIRSAGEGPKEWRAEEEIERPLTLGEKRRREKDLKRKDKLGKQKSIGGKGSPKEWNTEEEIKKPLTLREKRELDRKLKEREKNNEK
jgi:hypothetical protein